MTQKLSIYLNEGDLYRRRPMYLELLELFKKEGCSGATVLRAVSGFTRGKIIQTSNIVELATTRLPLVVEMIESEEKIRDVLPRVREMVAGRLVTLQDIRIV